MATLFFAVLFCAVGLNGETGTSPRTLLELAPCAGNPRNSEGAFARLADGRILFAYSKYVGSDHDDNAACVIALRSSRDGGETWSDDRIVARNSVETNGNVMSVSFLPLDGRRLAMFYIQKETAADRKGVLSRILMAETSDGGETWSAAADCTGGVLPKGYYVLNNDRVVRLKSGRVVLPIALGDSSGVLCAYSDDGCRTWKASARVSAPAAGGGSRILFEEPGLVERRDGSVVMYLRTNTGRQWRAVSSDGCATWGAAEPWRFASPRSPMQIARLGDGTLLAVWNDMTRHPERLKKSPPWTAGPRTPLTLAVSADDGETWSAGKDLETSFDPRNFLRYWYCYPAAL
ncbi:MAG: glycoside hydrolase, partial [Kiritimatiellae bacterium]|nr:glycoside hydrolase [Kiritimatiellia bacterium]